MEILVVEDDETVASLLGHIFQRHGYAINQIADGREAVARVTNGEAPPDVVILDYMLPYVSGLDILKAIRGNDRWKDVPVIFLSARTSPADVATVLEAGANDYVTKPFGIDELGARVKRFAPPAS
jgi:DNA-binding response OmpR family regulator